MLDAPQLLDTLLHSRQTILPKRLSEPGPDAQQFGQIVGAAAHAPDHGALLPWRFVVIPDFARATLGDVFAQALLERDAAVLPPQLDQAREKALRAPLLMLLVVQDQLDNPKIDFAERVLSAGCAIQNMLLMATAMGFGSALTSGKALKSNGLRRLFALQANEHATCFVSIGTVTKRRPARIRPSADLYLSTLCLEKL